MSEMSMLPVPVVQMGLVEKLVEVEQNQPHVQQLVAQESARQALRADAGRVPQVGSPEGGKKIRDREAGQKNRERQHASDQRAGEYSGDDDAQENADGAQHKANPWAGLIVNMKI